MKTDLCKPSVSPAGWQVVQHPRAAGSHHSVCVGNRAGVSLRRWGRGRVPVTRVQVGIMSKLLSTSFLLKTTVLHLCNKRFKPMCVLVE